MKELRKPLILILLILVIDQLIKIYVKTHFAIGDDVKVLGLDWFRIHFLENKGMAFGMSFGNTIGKFLLTLIRVVLSVAIFIYMNKLIKRGEKKIIIYSFALIFAGAVGNIIDCLFYGIIFNESTVFAAATMFPAEGGYAPFLFGRVVDMFYFPLIDTTWPDWIPFVGGNNFRFFNAIFNFADASITIGVVLLLVSYIWLSKSKKNNQEDIAVS
ncbi:MAG: lipoprotein signal peptidase [Bacteroidales bacterium]|nr:lipoprotein signal peptidase [Bacteroidales bacterium]MEE3413117.1 lipoprotein signal peptidase [Bacteroidales bacterium]